MQRNEKLPQIVLEESIGVDMLISIGYYITYIVSGQNDTTVPTKNQLAIKAIYEHYSVTKLEYTEKAIGHTVPQGQPALL